MSRLASRGRGRLGRRVLAVVLAVAASAVSLATAQPLAFAGAVEAAVHGPDVAIAVLQWQQAEAAARVASQVVSGSVRTGASVDATGVAGTRDVDVSLRPLSVQASFLVVPYGPGHDAAMRSARGARDAQDAVATAALRAALTAAERWWVAERAERQSQRADERVTVAQRSRDAVLSQVEAGTASPGALADAELALVQAHLDAASAAVDRTAALDDLSRTLGRPVTTLAPRSDAGPDAAARWLAGFTTPSAGALEAAALASERVRTAERSLADAVDAAERARRDAGLSASLTANLAVSGDAGRVTLGGAIDTRGYQPSVDLGVDPFSNAPAGTSASLSLSVTVPIASERGAEFTRFDLAATLERERLEQARAQSRLDLAGSVRAVEQAAGALRLALDRLALRRLQLQASEARHEAGTVAPLDHDRARLDVADAELALDRALDTARLAQAQLALALGEHPFDALGLGTTERDAFDARVEGILMEAP